MTPSINQNPDPVSETIVSANLNVVQSKRLLLSSVERRHRLHGGKSLLARAEGLRGETDRAQRRYHSVVLRWAKPDSNQYRLVAYGNLIELADTLATELRLSLDELPLSDRFEVATEVEMLENLIDIWRDEQRTTLTSGAA
jgi:hypothetical protein